VTSVSACAPAARACSGRAVVERRHHLDRPLDQVVVGEPALDRGRHRAGPSGLVSTSVSPARPPALVRIASGCTVPVTARPYFGSGVVDRVAADDARPRGRDGVAPAAQDLRQQLRPERLERVRDEVERRHRHAAHRVDVAQRVGRGDAPERVRVVDDRGEEVGGLDEREVVGEADDAGVVGGRGGDQHARVARLGRPATIGRRSAADSLQPQPAPCEREVRAGGISRLSCPAVPEYTDAQLDAAVEALSDPEKLEEAQRLVASTAPQLQGILNQALESATGSARPIRPRCCAPPASRTPTSGSPPCGR
jgi:hypothetical protein